MTEEVDLVAIFASAEISEDTHIVDDCLKPKQR